MTSTVSGVPDELLAIYANSLLEEIINNSSGTPETIEVIEQRLFSRVDFRGAAAISSLSSTKENLKVNVTKLVVPDSFKVSMQLNHRESNFELFGYILEVNP